MSSVSSQSIAIVTGSFLSGAMMSLSLMAIPVLLDTTTQSPQLFHQWARMYHYGHQVLPTMAVGTFLLYSYSSLQNRKAQKSWGVVALAGVVTMCMLPFTWIFMVPTNNELFRLEAASKVQPAVMGIRAAKELIVKWSWLHIFRSMLPLTGAVMGTVGRLEK